MIKNDERTVKDIPVVDDIGVAQTKTSSLLAIQPSWDETPLTHFLQVELAIPAASISLALRRQQQDPAPLPMILWQYGLISTAQLEQTFDWLEHSSKPGSASRGSSTAAVHSCSKANEERKPC